MKEYLKCLRCGRKLQSEESKQRGYGNTCWEKYTNSVRYKELFKVDSQQTADTDNINMSYLSNNKSD